MRIKNKLYEPKEVGRKDISNKILQFNIKLKEAISKQKNFLLKNNFELKILIGTKIINENRKKMDIICKSSIIFI